jgi:type IV pilus assembly PilX-like protein
MRPLRHVPSAPRVVIASGRLGGDERGAALVLALMILVVLTGLALALLSTSGFEPQIASNLSRTIRARYVAEAGLEYAYHVLATDPDAWNDYLAGATCTLGALLGPPTSNFPGLSGAYGAFSVRIRNDCGPDDARVTGVSLDTTAGPCGADAGTATRDANCRVMVAATGAVGGTTRTITAVMSRTIFPRMTAALAFPGLQAGVDFESSRFSIDGRDSRLSDDPGLPTGSGPAVYGIAVNDALPTLVAEVRDALAGNPQNEVRGKDESGTGTTTGAGTIRSDGTLTSPEISDFVARARSTADVTIDAVGAQSIGNVGSACSTDGESSACWGTTDSPKIVYVGGAPSPGSPRPALGVTGESRGAGILVVENATVEIDGNFRWNGLVIVTGRDAAVRYRGGGTQAVYGGFIVDEPSLAGTTHLSGSDRDKTHILYSKESLDLVQRALQRRFVATYGWNDR